MPGIIEQELPARQYPVDDRAGGHLFGYVSEVSESDLARPEYAGAEPGLDGREGRDRAAPTTGCSWARDGDRIVVVNSRGREMGDADEDRADRKGAASS